jgi:hypothetical protein
MTRTGAAAAAIVLLVVATRLCHLHLVWIEEAYGMAAAAEVLRGKLLYRDIWFDKPPLYAMFYALWGAGAGLALRLAGAAWVLLGCLAAFRWFPADAFPGERLTAAALLAFFLTFDIPSAVMALAPDLLMLPLHVGAVLLAMRGQAFAAGLTAGTAMLFNTKAIFVVAACLVWAPPMRVLMGFALPNLAFVGVLWSFGAWESYVEQVWRWGMRYSDDTFVAQPWKEALVRTLNWAGFHAALVIGAGVWLRRRFSWRVAAWVAVSFAAVCAGWRFFPRYYFHLLPPMLFAGVRGLFLLSPRWRTVALLTLLIPVVRFGPRYIQLASGDRQWADLALMNDSRDAASIVRSVARPGDRLLVWGYRPDVFVFSGLPAATRFLDSQPLNGVLADRHLTTSVATMDDFAKKYIGTVGTPEIIVDGLGPSNPDLAADRFPALRTDRFRVVGRTRASIIYAKP